MVKPMKAISISLIKSWKLSLKRLGKREILNQLQQMLEIILIDNPINLIILLFNWIVATLADLQVAIMLQAKEEADHKGALKEWKIFQELGPT